MKVRKVLKTTVAMWILMLMFAVVANAQTEGIFTYEITDNAVTITSVDADGGDIVIPDSIEGYPVTKLADRAFNYSNAQTVYIPSTLEDIGNAFGYLYHTFFVVDENNAYYSSDAFGALMNKEQTHFYKLPSYYSQSQYVVPDTVRTFARACFENCLYVEEVILPDGMEQISPTMFFACQSLRQIHIPEGVTTVGSNAFARCYSLESVSLPSTLTQLKESSFTECSVLNHVIIPEGVTSIGTYAFESDYALERIVIPSTVTEFGYGVFENCNAFSHLYYAGTEEQWGAISIRSSNNKLQSVQKHFEFDAAYYDELTVGCDEQIITVSGNGALGATENVQWHLWDEYAQTATAVVIDGTVDRIGKNCFVDYPELAGVVIMSASVVIEEGAFANCPMLKNVVLFGDSTISPDAFVDCAETVNVFQQKGYTHSDTQGSGVVNAVAFEYDRNTLAFEGNVTLDAYAFFDVLSVFVAQFGQIDLLQVQSLTFEDIVLYYYDEANASRVPIENNTLKNGEITAQVFKDGEIVNISVSELCNGIADGSITEFFLIVADEEHGTLEDTQVQVKESFADVIMRALRWIVTLINKLFKMLKSLVG